MSAFRLFADLAAVLIVLSPVACGLYACVEAWRKWRAGRAV